MDEATAKPTRSTPNIDESQLVFGLDIGTRSVIGVVGIKDGEKLRILATHRIEHDKRAMLDGQIEDINQVTKIVSKIKNALEDKLEVTLKTVAVAAAGRALRLQSATATTNFEEKQEIDGELVRRLETAAIEQAVSQLHETANKDEINLSFYCVGHSIVRQVVDGYEFSSLVGHKGNSITMDIIATFLPSSVVESLYTVVERNGMEVTCMTLEPIAAMNALIPKELRTLNLALVDIGAGTSDIAISRAGTILSYEMTTVAGDEITDSLSQGLLVDFDTAERLKKQLSEPAEDFTYEDILRVEYIKTRKDITDIIEDSSERLCSTICNTILEVNGGAPAAVFLVGGGSLLPGLCERVSTKLDIPAAKVAVGQTAYFRDMVVESTDIKGPEYMTPLGIVITNFLQQGYGLYSVTLNGKPVKIFNDRNLIVGAILVAGGIALHNMVGAPGSPLSFFIDGTPKTVRGAVSASGRVTLNGIPASINSPVKVGDIIEATTAENGKNAEIKLCELFDLTSNIDITVDGRLFTAGLSVKVNDKEVEPLYPVQEGDKLTTQTIKTTRDLSRLLCLRDGEALQINGRLAGPDTPLFEKDVVTRAVSATGGSKTTGITITLNGEEQFLEPKGDDAPFIFADALNFVTIDKDHPQGVPVLKLNGRDASYSEGLMPKDNIEITWK